METNVLIEQGKGPLDAAAQPRDAISTDYVANPLFLKDGAYHVRLCGYDLPLLLANAPITGFLAGWNVISLYAGFAPLMVLEFRSETGDTALWFLDGRLNHVCGDVASLPPSMLALLRHRACPLLRQLMAQLLEACEPQLDAALLAFMRLQEQTRAAIGSVCMDELVRPPSTLLAIELQPHSLLFNGQDGVLRAIDRAHLAAGLETAWQDRLAGFFRSSRMMWPSPIDGCLLEAQGAIALDDFHFAYRFVDQRHGLAFLAMVGEHNSRLIGVWFPTMDLLVSHDEYHQASARYLAERLPRWFIDHTLRWASLLVPALATASARSPRRFASVLRGRPGVHIGHQLWNELSGIDRLVSDSPDALPDWLILGPDIELYGPIDRLYPELAGRVDRSLPNAQAMIGWAYENRVFLLRVTRETVSRHLRERIQMIAAGSPAAREVFRIVARRAERRPPPPVILIGLRVENRTIVDLDDFLGTMAATIADRHPGATLVLDGHNARSEAVDGQVIESHGEDMAGDQPVDVERRIADRLRRAMQGRDLVIADTIGRPMSASLAWTAACDCFISIWGASLAKYRWVGNRPGFVLSSRFNLMHRSDLHIYDAPIYMEDPTPLQFIASDCITDDPQAALLVPVAAGDPSFFNFHVDVARVLPDIMQMIERVS